MGRLFAFTLRYIDNEYNDGISYFEKISTHTRSLNLTLKCLFRRKDDLAKIYEQIAWKWIPSFEEEVVLNVIPKEASEIVFNDCLSDLTDTIEGLTSDEFYQENLTKLESYDSRRRRLANVHAEILLINYLVNNGINETNGSSDVEIGISKLPCLLCSFYVRALNNKYNRCFFSSESSNGKIDGEWLLRNSEDSSVIQSII